MSTELLKTVNEQIWYPVGNFNFVLDDDETISSATVKVYNDLGADVTSSLISGTPQISGKRVFAFIIAGAVDEIYQCRTLITTSISNKYEAIGRIKIVG
jgi:hypothetical protein